MAARFSATLDLVVAGGLHNNNLGHWSWSSVVGRWPLRISIKLQCNQPDFICSYLGTPNTLFNTRSMLYLLASFFFLLYCLARLPNLDVEHG
eukprot:COSAG01_NODE_5670_length_4108_cov_15.236219_4_plen_92_part_00